MPFIPKLEEKRHFCQACKAEVVFEVKMQRADTCPHCATDLHSCKNCQYWDASAHNQCREQIAEYIPDRDTANRCTFFTFKSGAPDAAEDLRAALRIEGAKAKLEALFKKK